MNKAAAIIPARYQSSRFPGKPLAIIGDKPMIQHVYEKVSASGLFETVIVATDNKRISDSVEDFGGKVIMTSSDHQTGTERCAEAAASLEGKIEIVVNVQGDEPFIDKEPLEEILNIFSENDAQIATLVQPIHSVHALSDPNVVKVVVNSDGKALYFSRSAIPYLRDVSDLKDWPKYYSFLKHIGIYAYRRYTLNKLVKLRPADIELAESLEQLRWLNAGYEIYTAETNYNMLSVDTPEDLERAREFLRENIS